MAIIFEKGITLLIEMWTTTTIFMSQELVSLKNVVVSLKLKDLKSDAFKAGFPT